MTIKIITTILLYCTTTFASQEPTILDKFQMLAKTLTTFNGNCAIAPHTIDSKKEYSDTSTITYLSITTGAKFDDTQRDNSHTKRYLRTIKYNDQVITDEDCNNIKNIIFENYNNLTRNSSDLDIWKEDPRTSLLLTTFNNTLIVAQNNGYLKVFNRDNNYANDHKQFGLAFNSKALNPTALDCSPTMNGNIAIGSQDGSIIITNIINTKKYNLNISHSYLNKNYTTPITSIHYLSDSSIIYAQKNQLLRLIFKTNGPFVQLLNAASSNIKHTTTSGNAIAYCDFKDEITIIPDINNYNETIKLLGFINTINSICLHTCGDTLYLYAGDQSSDMTTGNLYICKITTDGAQLIATIPQQAPVFFIGISENGKEIIVHTASTENFNLVNNILCYPTPYNIEKNYCTHNETYQKIIGAYTSTDTPRELYNLIKNNTAFLFNCRHNQFLAVYIQNKIKNKIKNHITLFFEKESLMVRQTVLDFFDYFKSIFLNDFNTTFFNHKPEIYINNGIYICNNNLVNFTKTELAILAKKTNQNIRTELLNKYQWLNYV